MLFTVTLRFIRKMILTLNNSNNHTAIVIKTKMYSNALKQYSNGIDFVEEFQCYSTDKQHNPGRRPVFREWHCKRHSKMLIRDRRSVITPEIEFWRALPTLRWACDFFLGSIYPLTPQKSVARHF